MTERRYRLLSLLVTVPLAVGAAMTLLWTGGVGGQLSLLRLLIATLAGAAIVAAPLTLDRRAGAAVAVTLCCAVLAFWLGTRPSTDRDWHPQFERAPHATFDGSRVTVHDVRDFRWADDGTWQPAWYDATYDLDELEGAYLVLTTFSRVVGVGHVMVSFRFAGDRFLVMSVEARRQVGETYDPVGGAFRQYELFYLAADERDAIAVRTQVHGDETWIMPIHAGVPATRAFLVDMLERMNELRDRPAWYNTLTSSCATNLARHYERINDVRLPPDHRVIMPGLSQPLIEQLGMLPPGEDAATARVRYHVNPHAGGLPLDEHFSVALRRWELDAAPDEIGVGDGEP